MAEQRFRHRIVLLSTILLVGGLTLSWGVDTGYADPALPAPFQLRNPSSSQMADKLVSVAPGIEINLADYLSATDMRKRTDTKAAFDASFQRDFLKNAPIYEEMVEGEGDRLRVVRTLRLPYKDPCNPQIPKELSACFRPTGKKLSNEVRAELENTRAKIRAERKGRMTPTRSKQLQEMLALSDEALLGQLINTVGEDKVITHTSVLPYTSYNFGNIPNLNLHSRATRLPPGVRLPTAALRRATTRPVEVERSTPQDHGVSPRFNGHQRFDENLVLGWTIGRHVSDTFEIQFARKTRLTDRYYARFSYTVRLGMGVRFPMRMRVQSSVTHVTAPNRRMQVRYPASEVCDAGVRARDASLCASLSEVSVSAQGLDGNARFYEQAGVPSDQIFDGKEFVLEAGFNCQFYASIPGPNISVECPFSTATRSASADFIPVLHPDSQKLLDIEFSGRSLGLALDAGIGYAAINPGIRLFSENARLVFERQAFNSNVGRSSTLILTNAGQAESFSVAERVSGERSPWGVVLANPTYKLSSKLRPYLVAELGIDLGVYEWKTRFGPYTFGNFQIQLGQFSFEPHQGSPTSYRYTLGTRDER